MYLEEEDKLDDTFLAFNIEDKFYSIEIEYVTEVIEMQDIIDMPDMPMYVKGVINLRGSVISVINLRERLNVCVEEDEERQCIIIVKIDNKPYGLVVDNVNDVIEIDESKIDDSSSLFLHQDSITRGTAKLGDDLCVLLNVSHILN